MCGLGRERAQGRPYVRLTTAALPAPRQVLSFSFGDDSAAPEEDFMAKKGAAPSLQVHALCGQFSQPYAYRAHLRTQHDDTSWRRNTDSVG